jgi:hypothetical protein
MKSASPQQNFVSILAIVWLLIAVQLLYFGWSGTGTTLGDSDDAMRLVELRSFLAGQGWFDLHEARLAPPVGYDSHWSRLIDAGLAGLMWLLGLVASPATAERLTRVVWPLLWLIPALAALTTATRRLAGEDGDRALRRLAVLGLPAYQQFLPGRIDHHNVQITLAVAVLAATLWSDRRPWAAAAAGGLTGLALAIGFEGLPFVAVCGAILVARWIWGDTEDRTLTLYGASLAAGTAAAFLTGVGPAHWSTTACDALAINLAVPLVIAGLALAALGASGRPRGLVSRLLALGVVTAVVAAVSITLEPRCLSGPFAFVNPDAKSLWLAHVRENLPWLEMLRAEPDFATYTAAFPILMLILTAVLACDPAVRRDRSFQTAAMVLAVAGVLMMGAVKVVPYALWFGLPLAAVFVVWLRGRMKLSTELARVLIGLLPAPALVGICVEMVAVKFMPTAATTATGPDSMAQQYCLADVDYRQLAALPRGLVVSEIDQGPFVLALTPHSVMAAPYHRASQAIAANFALLGSPPDDARDRLRSLGVTYVALCTRSRTRDWDNLPQDRGPGFAQRLLAGDVPSWLEPVPEAQGAFAIFRVRPEPTAR